MGYLIYFSNKGDQMQKIALFLSILIGLTGCVSLDNAMVIDAPQDELASASGQFRDARSGLIYNLSGWGTGAGASAASSALSGILSLTGIGSAGLSGSSASGSGGLGAMGFKISPPPTQGDPLPFARAIATINYSKKLKSITYDQFGGVIDYEFAQAPVAQSRRSDLGTVPKLPSAFGYQPVE
jgi:hypothetical protein